MNNNDFYKKEIKLREASIKHLQKQILLYKKEIKILKSKIK